MPQWTTAWSFEYQNQTLFRGLRHPATRICVLGACVIAAFVSVWIANYQRRLYDEQGRLLPPTYKKYHRRNQELPQHRESANSKKYLYLANSVTGELGTFLYVELVLG